MGKYLKKFETTAAYNAAKPNLILPNVSLITETNGVAYNPSSPVPPTPPVETRVVCEYNVTSTSDPTPVSYKYSDGGVVVIDGTSGFSKIIIDGVEQQTVESAYTFSNTGSCTVEYVLSNRNEVVVSAFDSCSAMISITLPDTITNIGDYAFEYCDNLTSIDIPSGVTSIGNQAFWGCSGLTSASVPSGVTRIEVGLFDECSSMTSVTIGDNVTYIGESAFEECSNLLRLNSSTNGVVNIPSGVTSIENQAFWGCEKITSVNIPSAITNVGSYAFSDCTGLTGVTINATTPPACGYTAFNRLDNYPIYVPSASVNAYKAAEDWEDYVNRIQAIP